MTAQALAAVALATALTPAVAAAVEYRTLDVDGIQIFYREAGNPDAPTVLLLHGFPASSQMYAGLIDALADQYHLIAPDYPGAGQTVIGKGVAFTPTFDNLASVMTRFVELKGLKRFALYMQDFGGPVGMRMASQHPGWISALIVQNANSYDAGLSDGIRHNISATSAGVNARTRPMLEGILSTEGVQFMYRTGLRQPQRVAPEGWTNALWGLQNPVNRNIQMGLLANYQSNLDLYPAWQTYLRDQQPPTLVVWGKNDPLFTAAGALAYGKDVKKADIHLLDTGHFALDEETPAIAAHMRRFLAGLPAAK
ncbi:Haloalkane dehalogenase 2 [Andreprevotia sp. IGB-42]|uniref:alpha/beta fold hydrolase n=1 Tax=Andreprevotia sp. IGB-42 TaxID=2497473 RepID=UPI0013587F02|nr:alpha/beta hydrolase [Andreprevotia sp. IGB-42]KAF0814883.1 Haloalkane dehalogenase 2 [Andreprevotia sp. IGB-42]